MPPPYHAAVLGGTVQVELELPTDATPREPVRLDVSALPEARVDLERSWLVPPDRRIELGCAHAAADRWVKGIDDVVLAAATSAVRQHARLTSVQPLALERASTHVAQSFCGAASTAAEPITAHGRHVLGFSGSPKQVVVCSVVCLEPSAAGPSSCAPLAASLAVGPFAPPPEDGLALRVVVEAANHPTWTVAVLALLGSLAIAALLARRPRPRW